MDNLAVKKEAEEITENLCLFSWLWY